MKGLRRSCFVIFLLLALVLFPFSLVLGEGSDLNRVIKNTPKLAIEDIVVSPSKFDGKKIFIKGRVSKVKHVKLGNGKSYTAFKIEDAQKNSLGVYVKGIVDNLKEGTVAEVYGKFNKEKRYLFMSFKNVVKAKKVFVVGQIASRR